jgi:hypothetical protein
MQGHQRVLFCISCANLCFELGSNSRLFPCDSPLDLRPWPKLYLQPHFESNLAATCLSCFSSSSASCSSTTIIIFKQLSLSLSLIVRPDLFYRLNVSSVIQVAFLITAFLLPRLLLLLGLSHPLHFFLDERPKTYQRIFDFILLESALYRPLNPPSSFDPLNFFFLFLSIAFRIVRISSHQFASFVA